MKVLLYQRQSVSEFAALAEGCQAAGYSVVWQRPGVWQPNDIIKDDVAAVVIHGLHGNASRIREEHQKLGHPVWILDLPRLREEEHAVGLFLNDLHWLPSAIYRRPVAADPVESRAEQMILLIAQKPGDHAHGMDQSAINTWLRSVAKMLRDDAPHLPIVLRWHPKNPNPIPADHCGAHYVSDPEEDSLSELLANASFVVVYNSTVAWDAIAAGTPVLAMASREQVSCADYVAFQHSELRVLSAEERATALSRAASSQWTLEELRNGVAARACFAGELPALPQVEDAQPDIPVDEVALSPVVDVAPEVPAENPGATNTAAGTEASAQPETSRPTSNRRRR